MLAFASNRSVFFWRLQIGGWLVLILPFTGMNLVAGFPPGFALLNGIFRQTVGFLLTLVLWRIYRHWSFRAESPWRYAATVLAFSLGATAADLGVFELLHSTLHLNFGADVSSLVLFGASVGRLALYLSWSVLFLTFQQVLDVRDRMLQVAGLEIAARDAELQMLRAQLNPHFLFNALNSIIAESEDNPRAKAITLGLSDLLRFSLRQPGHFGVLGEELAVIDNYLHIERARFEERLKWQVAASPAACAAHVPCALLLPLVENAVKFGLRTSPQGLELRIGAELRDGIVTATVENSGHWIEPDPEAGRSTHIGLANLRRRLELLCGQSAGVAISTPPGFVRVEVRVPLRQAAA
ncbi:MAG: histidine kinase [Verrucomicrobia bacterium]|nr:histidine kinase [Verrucomicrobiota bacterium]